MINKKIPETFCSVPWLQIHTEPDGMIMPCCYYNSYYNEDADRMGNWRTDSLSDVFYSDKWNQLRKDFLDGKKPKACDRCWREEDTGVSSMRTTFNEKYSKHTNANYDTHDFHPDIIAMGNDDGTVSEELDLATVDIIFNNLCNFKCRSCGPALSSSIAVEEQKLIQMGHNLPSAENLLTNSNTDHMTDDLQFLVNKCDEFTEVHFSGGEPMMQKEHYEFLELMIASGKTSTTIRYNTNLSVYTLKDRNAFELLQHFDKVFMVGSVDAMGEQGGFIRNGFDWERCLEWIETCKEYLPNADYGISSVYSLLNSLGAVDLHRYICENELFKNGRGETFGFYLNKLSQPDYMRTTVLPPEIKSQVNEKIEKHIEWLMQNSDNDVMTRNSIDQWTDAMKIMNSKDETHLIPDFYHKTRILDNIRSDNFETTFPELHQYMRHYDTKI